MERKTGNGLSLVVMETGACWPSWIAECQGESHDAIIEAQTQGETPSDFAKRVISRVRSLTARKSAILVSVIASNAFVDQASLDARYAIARAMLHAMSARAAHGELFLTAEAQASDERRHNLFALAGTLCDELHGTALGVSVRFAGRSSESGTIRSVPEVASEAALSRERRLLRTADSR